MMEHERNPAASALVSLGMMLAASVAMAQDGKKSPSANAVGAAGKWDTTAVAPDPAGGKTLDERQTD